MVMKLFDSSKQIYLLTDVSGLHGLFFALRHVLKGRDCIDTCAPTSLTSAEKNYSTIKLECLAIVWTIQKCSYYLLGLQDFLVITNYKPLEDIFEKTLFDQMSLHLQHLRD